MASIRERITRYLIQTLSPGEGAVSPESGIHSSQIPQASAIPDIRKANAPGTGRSPLPTPIKANNPASRQTDDMGRIAIDGEKGEVALMRKAQTIPFRSIGGRNAYTYGKRQQAKYGKFEGLGGVSYELLRLTVRQSPLLKAIHSARRFQTKRWGQFVLDPKKDIGARIVHDRQYDPDFEITDAIRKRCAQVQRLFETPHPVYERSFNSFEIRFTEEHLAINRPVIELIKDRRGRVLNFALLDGALLEPTYLKVKAYVRNNADQFKGLSDSRKYENAQGRLSEEHQVSFYDDFIYFVDGIPQASFTDDELIIAEDHQPVDIAEFGFPASCAEDALQQNLSFIRAFAYNSKYFTSGQMVDVILGLSGDFSDDVYYAVADQLRSYRGVEGAFEVPLVPLPAGSKFDVTELKNTNREMQFMEFINFLVSITTAIYRMNPSEINFKGMDSGRGAVFEHSKDTEIEAATGEGFHSILTLKEATYTRITKTIDPELRFEYHGKDRESQREVIELLTKEVASHKSPNEARKEQGLPVYDEAYLKEAGFDPDDGLTKDVKQLLNLPANTTLTNAFMQLKSIHSYDEQAGDDGNGGGSEVSGAAGDGENGTEDAGGGRGERRTAKALPGNGNEPPVSKGKTRKAGAERWLDSVPEAIRRGGDPDAVLKAMTGEFVPIHKLLKDKAKRNDHGD